MRETEVRILLHRLYDGLNLTGEYSVVTKFNVPRCLMLLNVNKTSNRNEKYNTVTNISLMDDPANTGGESIWLILLSVTLNGSLTEV
jgi:hypothetical protein